MKVEDVMVGDVVIDTKTNKPKRLTCNNIKWGGINRFIPMRITPELLEKNGFVCKNEKTPVYEFEVIDDRPQIFHNIIRMSGSAHFNVMKGFIEFTWFMDSSNTEHLKIEYIHEFQHALKICKINKYIAV